MIKLVATDIDGTLVPESSVHVNPELYEIVPALKERGIVFAAASGRQYESMHRVFAPVADDVLFIAENGANVMFRDQNISATFLQKELAEELILHARKLPQCEIMLSTLDKTYLETEDEQFAHLMLEEYRFNAVCADDVLPYAERTVKIAIYRRAGIAGLFPEVEQKFGHRMNVMISGDVWIDCISATIDKGKALREAQRAMGISREETMAFGDNCNDIPLLENAGESYAVANADPRLKAVAKHLAPACADDGVLSTIRERLLA